MGAPKGFVGRARRAALLFRPGLSWPTNNGTPLRCPHPVRSKSLVTVTATLALVGFLAVLAGAAASPVSGASAGRSATGLEGPSYLPAMSTSSTLGWSLAPNLPAGFRTEALSCVPAFCLAVGSSGQTEVLRTGSRSWTKVAGSPVALSWAEQWAQDEGPSLSCTRPSFCMLVGVYLSSAGKDKYGDRLFREDNYAVEWSSGHWQPSRALYFLTGPDMYLAVNAVVCTRPTFCMASPTPSGSARWDGSSWASQRGTTSGTDGNGVLACTSPSFCIAVFDDWTNIWRGKSWGVTSSPSHLALPGLNGFINSVACASSSFCVAAGHNGVSSWDGAHWSKPARPRGVSAVADLDLVAVSCATASLCITTDGTKFAYWWDGTLWRPLPKPFPIPSSQAPSSPRQAVSVLVSCAPGASCTVVDGTRVIFYRSAAAARANSK